MKNKILILICFILFIVAMIGIKISLDNANDASINKEIINTTENNTIKESCILEVKSDTFEEEVLNSTKIVVIDFYATWCSPCKIYTPIVEEFAKENEEIKVVKIDIDETQDIAMKYNVMSIPTTIIIKDGKEVDRAVGVINKDVLSQMVK